MGLKSYILWNIKIKQEIFFPRIGKVSPDIWEILSFLSLGIESSIPWNIRKTFFWKVCFWKNMRNLLILEVQSSTSQITRNFSFFWKKCQAYLILGARKFHFLKYKKNVYWRKYNKVFRNGFFLNFLSLCWKLSQIALGPTTLVSLCWRVFWPKFNICRCITKIP